MSGEDRQQFARDAEARRQLYLEQAESMKQGERKRRTLGWAKLAEQQRNRYDDAGEFKQPSSSTK